MDPWNWEVFLTAATKIQVHLLPGTWAYAWFFFKRPMWEALHTFTEEIM